MFISPATLNSDLIRAKLNKPILFCKSTILYTLSVYYGHVKFPSGAENPHIERVFSVPESNAHSMFPVRRRRRKKRYCTPEL